MFASIDSGAGLPASGLTFIQETYSGTEDSLAANSPAEQRLLSRLGPELVEPVLDHYQLFGRGSCSPPNHQEAAIVRSDSILGSSSAGAKPGSRKKSY